MELKGSLGRSGLFDWLVQRLTAVLLAAYTLFWVFYLGIGPKFTFTQWKILFARPEIRIVSLLVLLSLLIHSWIGIWIVITDYLKNWIVRYVAMAFFLLAFSYCLAFGISILWGL